MSVRFQDRLLRAILGPLINKYKVAATTVIEELAVPGCGGVVFLGDSLTAGSKWDLMFPGLLTLNFGISGDTTTNVLDRLAPVISVKPSKLFLLIGTNDLGIGTTVDVVEQNVAKILDQLGAALPGCALHLQTLLPRQPFYGKYIRQVNERFVGVAKTRNIPLIDLHPLFDDGTDALKKSLTFDDLHLVGAGYRVWQQALVPYLSSKS